jgi:hypothetical protein
MALPKISDDEVTVVTVGVSNVAVPIEVVWLVM